MHSHNPTDSSLSHSLTLLFQPAHMGDLKGHWWIITSYFFSFEAFPLLVQYSMSFHFRSPELSCTIFKGGILALCWCAFQGICVYLYVSLWPRQHTVLTSIIILLRAALFISPRFYNQTRCGNLVADQSLGQKLEIKLVHPQHFLKAL